MTLVDIEAPRTDFRRRGKFKVPVVPHPTTGKDTAYGRPSSHGKWVEDSYGLQLWGKRMVAVGVATTPSLIATIASLDPRDDANKQKLNDACEAALIAAKGNEAADVGTALHHITERVDRGELSPDDVPELFKADVAAMLEGRQAAGLTVVDGMIEVHCICDELRLAGTFDRILTDGTRLYSSDLKTGKDPSKSQVGYSVQGAIYSRSVGFDPVRNERYDLPKVDQNIALIEHLPAGQGIYTLYVMDISDEGGWGLALLADKVKKSSRRNGLLVSFDQRHKLEGGGTDNPPEQGTTVRPGASAVVGSVDIPNDDVAAPVTDSGESAGREAAGGRHGPLSRSPESAILHEARTAWLVNRAAHLADVLSKQHLAQVWPVDIARPAAIKDGSAVWTEVDIDTIVNALDGLEAKHDIPFGDEDPGVTARRRADLDAKLVAEKARIVERQPDPEPTVEGGPFATADDVALLDKLTDELRASTDPVVRARAQIVQAWQREGDAAGVPWKVGDTPKDRIPVRLWTIVMAAIGCMDLLDLDAKQPDTRVRDALAVVLDDHDLAEKPTNAVGAMFGLLSVEQAERLAGIADQHTNHNKKADTP